ncbi:MAG: type I glyceraldehyde-3-phosphate dehydrogenase [Alphaproteobacteria bacterium]
MTTRVAINGFGRIGRLTFRAALESDRTDLEFVGINDLSSAAEMAHLLKYDSVHGRLPMDVSVEGEDRLIVGGKSVQLITQPDPTKLPWGELGVDVVMECTGRFTKKESASAHLQAGAKKVLISAPCGDADRTIVYGVNHQGLTSADTVVSNASCTTNCLAPVVHVLHEAIGIERGYMTTCHAYTGDQRLVDTAHSDWRRARSAGLSMIPTSTGAARAVGLVLPHMQGKLDGCAIRVPTADVSMVDFTFDAGRDTSAEEINAAIEAAAASGPLAGILATNDEPLVSIDFTHHPASSIFDLTQTTVLEGRFVRILTWYDNEWGFSNRMADTAVAMGKLI